MEKQIRQFEFPLPLLDFGCHDQAPLILEHKKHFQQEDYELEKHYEIPANYKNKLFLIALDIEKIVELGENKIYEFLKQAPFRVVKVGSQYSEVYNSLIRFDALTIRLGNAKISQLYIMGCYALL